MATAEFIGIACDNSTAPTPLPTNYAACLEVKHDRSWLQGQDGKLTITFPQAVNSWELAVSFNLPISSLQFYEGEVTRKSAKEYTIKNKNYNGVKSAGDKVTSGWQAAFPENTEPAKMVSAQLVGINC